MCRSQWTTDPHIVLLVASKRSLPTMLYVKVISTWPTFSSALRRAVCDTVIQLGRDSKQHSSPQASSLSGIHSCRCYEKVRTVRHLPFRLFYFGTARYLGFLPQQSVPPGILLILLATRDASFSPPEFASCSTHLRQGSQQQSFGANAKARLPRLLRVLAPRSGHSDVPNVLVSGLRA